MSLKYRIALSIATLSFVPNIVVLAGFLLSTRGQNSEIWLPLLLWAPFLALGSAGVGYLVATVLMRPVDELTRSLAYLRSTERVLAELTLPRPKERPPAEIAELREGFEELLEHLRQVMEGREAVFATLAHDLKTPLLAAIRALEYLEDADSIGPLRRKEVIRDLWKELSRSYWLVENLLTASRLETQKPNPEMLNLRAMLEDLRLRFADPAKQAGISLEVAGAGQARVDRHLLERALTNLITNALRHAKNRVMLRAGEGWVEVEDDGPGLPDSLERLSQPFRSQRLRGVRAGSAGLGMYVARRVAEVHGGKLESPSGQLGGACLRLRLN